MVIILQLSDATLVSHSALEKGRSVVDIHLHGNAAGSGDHMAVLGPGHGVVVHTCCPLGVGIPIGNALRIVGLNMGVVGYADGAVAEVNDFGGIEHVVDGGAGGREQRCGGAVNPGDGTGSGYLTSHIRRCRGVHLKLGAAFRNAKADVRPFGKSRSGAAFSGNLVGDTGIGDSSLNNVSGLPFQSGSCT